MKLNMPKKKLYLLLLFFCLILAAVTMVIYLFVNNETQTTYSLDKYSDVSNWCDITNNGNELKVDCKALLLNISNNDNNSCFDTQVIANDKELENLTVCENGDTLTYTNEVLGYKVLMPIDMVFTYTRESILNDYRFKNVSITKLDDSYVESIVNEDISNLVTIDPSSTTIKNSVDFCPRPEILPEYVTQENKDKYTEFFNNNIMPKEEYFDPYLYNWDDSTIRILFACDSAENMGYTDVCDKSKVQGLDLLSVNISTLTTVPDWNKTTMSTEDEALLKEISLIYDSMFLRQQKNNIATLDLLNDLVLVMNRTNQLNSNVFCSFYSLLTEIKDDQNLVYMENILTSSLSSNIFCQRSGSSNQDLDKNGTFVKTYISNSNKINNFLVLVNQCINLNNI